MLNKYQTKRQEGFTIIEVLIVLAIAGLIILIVFLAVPALQRNSRNTQYKNDASALSAAASEFVSNRDGILPVAGNEGAVQDLAKTKAITVFTIEALAGTPQTITPTFDHAYLVTGAKCGPFGDVNMTPGAASARSMIIIYAVETSSGIVSTQCIET